MQNKIFESSTDVLAIINFSIKGITPMLKGENIRHHTLLFLLLLSSSFCNSASSPPPSSCRQSNRVLQQEAQMIHSESLLAVTWK